MKKILLLAALVGVTTCSFGQGTLLWNNTSSTLISANGSPMPANNPQSPATTFHFALFAAPVGTPAPADINDPLWQTVVAYAVNSTSTAGAGRLTNPGQATVDGFLAGSSASFIVRGWVATTAGADWNAARAALAGGGPLGTSSVATLLLGGGTTPNSSLWGAGANQLSGMNIVVPEPSSMVLAGLGAASLLLFRRRK